MIQTRWYRIAMIVLVLLVVLAPAAAVLSAPAQRANPRVPAPAIRFAPAATVAGSVVLVEGGAVRPGVHGGGANAVIRTRHQGDPTP